MLDLSEKMAELKFEAPLAQFEETEDWGINDFRQFQVSKSVANLDNFNKHKADEVKNINNLKSTELNTASLQSPKRNVCDSDKGNENDNDIDNAVQCEVDNSNQCSKLFSSENACASSVADNFTETFSGSLEDLVNTFDEKITKCFCNYDESVEQLAPVQVRTQEEIMSECQMWWTITGNFGNILPIDWSKSYARKLQLSALNVNESEVREDKFMPDDLSSEDEAVAGDLDMHSLILSGLSQETEPPVKTAEEVIREIDDIMEESTECTPDSELSPDDLHMKKEVLQCPLYQDKLKTLSVSQLNEVYLELELLIRDYSETLIAELALRDELEYEKELKNSFISLLLAVQNRRRQYHVDKKKGKNGFKSSGTEPKYLTTVIPYHLDSGPLNNQALQVLIKILKAINEDSPTVPTLLTDYILKVLCPT